MAGTFKSFYLISLDASGARAELPNETLTIKRASDDTTIQTVESDDFGYVASEEIAGSPGEEVYFEHATYPERFYQTLGADEIAAISAFATFIVENLFVSVSDAVVVDIYIKEDGSENIDYLGSMSPNSTASFPKEVNTSKDFTLYSIPRDSSGQRRTTDFTQAKSETLSVTVRRFGYTIKDFYADASNTDSEDDLYLTGIPANTLTADGDKITAFFAGSIAATENNKNIWAKLNGEFIFDAHSFTQADGGVWQMRIWIIRNASGAVRTSARLHRSDIATGFEAAWIQNDSVSSLDFTTAINLILGAGGEASGDITAKMGYVKFEPAALVSEPEPEGEASNVIHLGDNVIHNTDNVIYTE